MTEIEWALEFFDPDYRSHAHPNGKLRYEPMRNERDARHAAMHKIPQGKLDYRAVSREVEPWRPVDMEPHQVTFIGEAGRRFIKGTGAIPSV